MEEKEIRELESAIYKVCSYCEEVCDRCEDCPVYKINAWLYGVRYE